MLALFFAFLLAGWPVLAQGRYETGSPILQDIWVDPVNGNDGNSGANRAEALRTVTAAWGRVPARQTLAGTGYRLRLTAGAHTSAPLDWESRWGTAQFPVIVEAADGAGSAALPAPDISDSRFLFLIGIKTAGGAVRCERCDHLLLRDVRITGEGLRASQSTHIYIEDSDASGPVDLTGVEHGHIVNSRLHHSRDWCVRLDGGSAQVRLESNEIYHCGTGGFVAGEGTLHIRFVNNIVHDADGAGLGVNGGSQVLLAHNTLYRVGIRSHAFELASEGDVYIYNNLILNPAEIRGQRQHIAAAGDPNLQMRGNVIWNGPADLPIGTESSAGLRAHNSFNRVRPALVNPALGDFRLAAALTARTFPIPPFDRESNAVIRDRDGRARVHGTAGAYEFLTTTAAAPSVSASPAALRFVIGEQPSSPATLAVTSTGNVGFQAAGSPAWITASPSGGTTPASLQVSVNGAGLAAGSHTGFLNVTPTGGSAVPVPVTLVVYTPGSATQIFNDVPSSHLWVDYIYLLQRFGVTVGCSTSPPLYCPLGQVTQAEMAAFVIRSILGETFAYSTTPYFSDSTSGWPFKYVQKMKELGINPIGCGGGKYCPDVPVTRGEMAAFTIRAVYGENFSFSSTPRFDDVPATHPYFKYVQKMWETGITAGCSGTDFCVSQPITRDQMSAFLNRAFFRYRLITPPPRPSPPAPSTSPTIAGCNIYPSDNVWNTPVDRLPLHSSSSTWVNTIGATRSMHPDFGAGLWEGGPIGIPFVVVPQGLARSAVSFLYDDESDAGPYPIPPNPPIEGGVNSTGDRHILMLEQGTCKLFEISAAYPNGNGTWRADAGAIFDLKVNGPLRPLTWTSSDAAGLPVLPGLIRYDEIVAGEIKHAIRFTAPQTKREFIWPARHYASSRTGNEFPPMGARFRLKANYDISGFSAPVQIILKALKKYGIILADNGSSWYISGTPDERWNNDVLVPEIHRLKGSDFEAVDTSSLMIDPNSGQARQP